MGPSLFSHYYFLSLLDILRAKSFEMFKHAFFPDYFHVKRNNFIVWLLLMKVVAEIFFLPCIYTHTLLYFSLGAGRRERPFVSNYSRVICAHFWWVNILKVNFVL